MEEHVNWHGPAFGIAPNRHREIGIQGQTCAVAYDYALELLIPVLCCHDRHLLDEL